MNSLKSILSHLPHAPGVYRFLDTDREVLYVGKAIDLKKRVSSYFQKQKNQSTRLRKLVEKTADIEVTVVDSELEALILETNLIKSYRPRYNILMKDDKNYVYLKVTLKEEYPRVFVTRVLEKDGARYFGPKSSFGQLRRTLEILKKIFPFRHCSIFLDSTGKDAQRAFKDDKSRQDHLKRCIGPCLLTISSGEYRGIVEQVVQFFEGKTDEIEQTLKSQMATAVAERKFEHAGLLRDRLKAIQDLMQIQRVSSTGHENMDVIGLVVQGGSAYVTLFMFRDGKLINQENFILNAVDFESGAELEDAEVLSALIEQYYSVATDFPRQVIIPEMLANQELLERWIVSMSDHTVSFNHPQRGKFKNLIDLANDNARSFAKQSQVKWQAGAGQDIDAALEGLKVQLKLSKIPNRIECYDISHLGGEDTVGSMVVFEKGFPKKSDYRHFKLRSVQEKVDDYEAMEEVLTRRLRYLSTQPNYLRKPKKAELAAIRAILEKEGLDAENLDQHKMLVVEKKKKIVGMGRLKPVSKDESELASLWVNPKFRGQGLGQEIVQWLLNKQKKGKVCVLTRAGLVDWYGAMGFYELKDISDPLKQKQERCAKYFNGESICWMVYRFKIGAEDSSFKRKPDLLVIDGGKGQLGVVVRVLESSHLKIPVIGLAKREEEIFQPGQSRPMILLKTDGSLQLLQRLRDEAHRFALKYQRNLRGKRMLQE